MERFKIHFEPKKGWMNDPNGLIEYKGLYHMFFQHNPYDIKWGPMHWGHTTTKDFIHFEEMPIALYPDMDYENNGGCFSGSSIEKDGKLYLFYTSVSKKYGQAQSVVISEDGFSFKKYENNPVIINKEYIDFRDPKVYKYNDEYKMVIGAKYNSHGRVLLYSSKDLLNWQYDGVLYDDFEYDNAIECPDLFYLDGKWILMYSKIGNSGSNTLFLVGTFDGHTFIKEESFSPIVGPHYYAPQTFSDSKGRRMIIGWFYSWNKVPNKDDYSAGALTTPSEIKLIKDNLLIYPVGELYDYIKPCNKSNINGINIDYDDNHIMVNDIKLDMKINDVKIIEDVKASEIYINDGEKSIFIYK